MELNFLSLEAIDCLASDHQSLSCSDARPENDWVDHGLIKCSRCYLLNVMKWKFHNSQKYRFHLLIEEYGNKDNKS